MRDRIQNKLRNTWEGYELPYILLPEDIDVSQVTDIFENLNSKGKRLSVFDLLIARLFRHDIPLKDKWDNVLRDHDIIKRYKTGKAKMKMPIYINGIKISQYCWAHLLRDIKDLEDKSENGKHIHKKLIEIFKNLKNIQEKLRKENRPVSDEFYNKTLQKIRQLGEEGNCKKNRNTKKTPN